MRYAIFSDIHGNLEALNAVIDSCREEGVRSYFCAGDIVGYGANPKECIERVMDIKALCVAGNHDWAVANKLDSLRFNEHAQAAVEWSRERLAPKLLNWLGRLELVQTYDNFTMVHGSLNDPQHFHYMADMQQSADTFYLMKTSVCFIGHTHKPQVFGHKSNLAKYLNEDCFELESGVKYIVNVGSVGQPRDGNPKAAYCIYDPDLQRIEIKRVRYDVAAAQSKIVTAGLPEALARRLTAGQ